MSDSNLEAQIEAARTYESLFVPALFEQWALKVVDAAHVVPGQRVLDLACGTGVLAREVCRRTGSTGYVAGVDSSAAMLWVAREWAPTIDWREGAAEAIPFPDESFDAVVSQFGLMFFVDREQALREVVRVLKPGGRLVVAVWDALHNIPAYAAEVELLERLAGAPAADALRAPFVLGHRGQLAEIFSRAGASSITVHTATGIAKFPSIRVMVEADLRGWLPAVGVSLTEEQIARILNEAEHVLGLHVTVGEEVTFEVRAHLVSARKS
jgi:SAM-dependent methyltransferase